MMRRLLQNRRLLIVTVLAALVVLFVVAALLNSSKQAATNPSNFKTFGNPWFSISYPESYAVKGEYFDVTFSPQTSQSSNTEVQQSFSVSRVGSRDKLPSLKEYGGLLSKSAKNETREINTYEVLISTEKVDNITTKNYYFFKELYVWKISFIYPGNSLNNLSDSVVKTFTTTDKDAQALTELNPKRATND